MQLIRRSATRYTLALAVVGFALSGCTSGESGNPSPETKSTTSTSSESSTSPPSSTPSGPGKSLTGYKPCVELTGVAAQLGLTEIQEDGTQECLAEYPDSVTVRVKAFPEIGLKDVDGGPNAEFSDTTVGSRKAKLVKKAFTSTACAVALEVSTTSRIDVVASSNSSLDKACDAATKVATAIEPKLPK